ncbi:MAG: FAD:protein FMN transferase [Nitrospirales bacterium]
MHTWPFSYCLSVICFILVSCSQEKEKPGLMELTGSTMGTNYTVKVSNLPPGFTPASIHSEIETILNRINGRMSSYQEHSELSSFNRAKTTDWIPVSSEMVFVVEAALQVSRLTDGAFDITVGPLVNLWGFGPPVPETDFPTDEMTQKILQTVGYQHIFIQNTPSALKKDHPDVQIDLSAIAKGYAVDQVAEYLESLELHDYLVEIGGELRGKGINSQGRTWKVAIEKPDPSQRAIHGVVQLQNMGMATSGDYRNFFEKNGQRYSHTIDPRTGRPITHNLASVTVLSDSTMQADALATGLMVLGPEAGFQLAEQEKLSALFITKETGGFHEKATLQLRLSQKMVQT